MKPKARQAQLKIETLHDETVVVDLELNKAHCLNKTAATIWGYCDGNTTLGEMTDRVHRELGLPRQPTVVRGAIQQLLKADLLEKDSVAGSHVPILSRRELSRLLLAQLYIPPAHWYSATKNTPDRASVRSGDTNVEIEKFGIVDRVRRPVR